MLGPGQRIAALDAVKAMAIGSACQHVEEATNGSVEVGVAGVAVRETITTGRSIYGRP